MLVGKLQGRPAAARGQRSLASFVGCISSADRPTRRGYFGSPEMRISVLEGFPPWDLIILFISLFKSE